METAISSNATFLRRTASTMGAVFCAAVAFSPWLAHSDESVRVTAFVKRSNTPPIVSSVTPSTDVIMVPTSNSQTVSLGISDPDSASVTYTITASSGAVLPENGTVSMAGGAAVVDFTYYAPANRAKFVPVTVTLNDASGNPPTVRTIQIYVYAN